MQKVYLAYLKKASSQLLGPLQLTSFNIITRAVVDTMMSKQDEGSTVTNLSDLFTDIHLECIESGIGGAGIRPGSNLKVDMEKGAEEDDDFDDMYEQTDSQESLVYQFAGLTKRAYSELGKGLGAEFDNSPGMLELRMNNWVSPVYARLQRRFVRFVGGNVEEKLEELEVDAFESMLRKVAITVEPFYHLSNEGHSKDPNEYPAWNLTDFILKIIRNSISCIDVMSVESKVVRMFQNEMSKEMRQLSKALEKIVDTGDVELATKDVNVVESMLNIGHAATAGVYSIWHIRGNIAGTEDESGQVNKEFLKPLNLRKMENMEMEDILLLLPRAIRVEIKGIIMELVEIYKPSKHQIAAAILAHAARVTAESELRALITYNSDVDDWPSSRDDAFIGFFSNLLSYSLRDDAFDEGIFYENLIAAAVLEETIGVREPRDSVMKSYTIALENAAQYGSIPQSRVEVVEKALSMMMRLPEGAGEKIRQRAFRNVIVNMIETNDKDIDSKSSCIGEMMGMRSDAASTVIAQMYEAKFDKTVGKVLMNAEPDILNMPDIGNIFLNEVRRSASPSMDQKACDERVIYIASAMIVSFLEMALEDSAKMMDDRASAMLHRCYDLSNNPLIGAIQPDAIEENQFKVIQTSSKMSTSRLSKQGAMQLIKLLGATKERLQGNSVATQNSDFLFSSSMLKVDEPGKGDEAYITFISSLQETLIKDYAAVSVRGL